MTATLIYDGDCPLCRSAMDWVRRNARPGALDYVACQDPDRSVRFPEMTEAQCMEAMQLVMADGAVYAGDKALPHLFLALRRWRWMARFFRIPGVALFAPIAYGFVARHRRVISILVARKHMDACAGEK